MITEDILLIISRFYGISILQLEQKDRHKEVVEPRQIAHYFFREFTKYSLSQIGCKIGCKDHATVLHSIRTVNNRLDTNREYREIIDKLRKQIILNLPIEKQIVEDMFMENDYY